MKNSCFMTDMADERVDEYKQVNNLTEIEGVKVEKDNNVVTVDVLNQQGSEALDKPIGKYITIEISDYEYLTEQAKLELNQTLANQIKKLYSPQVQSILVVGLGNEYITPDALGHRVICKLNITRHLLKYASELVTEPTRAISAISPGVLGTTGIETEEIIQGVVNNIKPDAVFAIDSLCSKSVERVGKTIQLSNTGITPGAGVGNVRQKITQEYLGVPVIAIGVPTVVSAQVIVRDTIKSLSEQVLEQINFEKIPDLIVTPKEVDQLIDNMASLISEGINIGT